MTLMSFAIPSGRSGARVTLHNVGFRLRLCEREVLWLSLARKWMVSFQGASLGWETGAESQWWHTHHRRSRDPTAWPRPHKTPVYPPAGPANPHSCLSPSTTSIRPLSEIRPWAKAAGRPTLRSPGPSTAALHARAFNGTQGQLGMIWGWKSDGPYNEAPHWAVNDRADVISCMFWWTFCLTVPQKGMKWRI